jgi:hypothetical protein
MRAAMPANSLRAPRRKALGERSAARRTSKPCGDGVAGVQRRRRSPVGPPIRERLNQRGTRGVDAKSCRR